jgi:hypothetical protein
MLEPYVMSLKLCFGARFFGVQETCLLLCGAMKLSFLKLQAILFGCFMKNA